MNRTSSFATPQPADRDLPGNGRVIEVELGEVQGMSVSLTVRPRDGATEFGDVVRLAEELRAKLGESDRRQHRSMPHAKQPEGDRGALFWSWAQPGSRG